MKFLLYADDTAIFFESEDISSLQLLITQESTHICKWLQINKLSLNTQKTAYQLYKNSNIGSDLTIQLNGVTIKEETEVKFLGIYIDAYLKWSSHIDHLSLILSRNIGIINISKYFLNKHLLLLLYNALVLPYISYCCIVWGFTYPTYINKIEILQKRVIRIIDNQHRLAHSDPIFKTLNILNPITVGGGAKSAPLEVFRVRVIHNSTQNLETYWLFLTFHCASNSVLFSKLNH